MIGFYHVPTTCLLVPSELAQVLSFLSFTSILFISAHSRLALLCSFFICSPGFCTVPRSLTHIVWDCAGVLHDEGYDVDMSLAMMAIEVYTKRNEVCHAIGSKAIRPIPKNEMG